MDFPVAEHPPVALVHPSGKLLMLPGSPWGEASFHAVVQRDHLLRAGKEGISRGRYDYFFGGSLKAVLQQQIRLVRQVSARTVPAVVADIEGLEPAWGGRVLKRKELVRMDVEGSPLRKSAEVGVHLRRQLGVSRQR